MEYKFRRENRIRWFFKILSLVTWFCQSSSSLFGQSVIKVPDKLEFAGVPIHLTQQGRLQVQREIERMYTYPGAIQTDITALRQLNPLIKPLLAKANLPDDFRFVALPFADIDTVGFWALSKMQARYLDLRVDNTIDERYHPIVSTEAVLNDLSRLQEKQRNYVLTLIRYLLRNMTSDGSVQIDPAYILLGSQNLPLMWKVLARKLAIEHEEPTYRPAVNYILYQYENGEGQTLTNIAQRLRVKEERIKPFNRWLKTAGIPTDKEYPVLIQVTPDEVSTVQALAEPGPGNVNLHQLAIGFPVLVKLKIQTDKLRSTAIFYEINERRGIQAQNCDNVITLAFYGHITINNFYKFNDLRDDRDVVRPGQIYYLQRKAKRAKIPFHVAQRNQTLREVADMYGVRLESLLTFNRMRPAQRVQTGQVLWLQKKRPSDQPVEYIQQSAEEQKTDPEKDSISTAPLVIVQDSLKRVSIEDTVVADSLAPSVDSLSSSLATTGKDTLTEWGNTAPPETLKPRKLHVVTVNQTYYSIARLYGVTVKQLYVWNNLSERIPLRIGQRLIVEAGEKQRIAATPPISKTISRGKLINSFVVTPPKRKAFFYTVHAGQTLYRVALINKVLVKDLMRWNNMKNYIIEVGQILVFWK